MKTLNMQTFAQYENQYIATSQDALTIYASDKTIAGVEKSLEKQKIKDAVISFIPAVSKALSPVCL